MKVSSIYEPTRVFVTDESTVPDRIFHEKGSNRWWTKNELHIAGAPENPATFKRPEQRCQMLAKCPNEVWAARTTA